MTNPLLIVDVQNAFINDYTHHIPGSIREIIERGDFDPLIFTRFINQPDGPYPKLLDWDDAMTPPDFDLVAELHPLVGRGTVYDKPGTTGLPGDVRGLLRNSGFERVTIVGLDTDMCVLKTALDVFDLGIEPIVLTDCCASTAGLQAHFAALAILARNIGAKRLHHAGTGGPSLGAP